MPPCRHLELRLPYLTLLSGGCPTLPEMATLLYNILYRTLLPLLYIKVLSSSSADLILSQIFNRNFARQ